MSQMFFYGVFLYILGVLGDRYDSRKILSIGLFTMSIWYLMLALLGFYDATNHAYYYIVLILTGISNAFLLPTFITINGNWFPIATRGLLASKWQSCNNIGNIVGAQVAAKLLDSLHG